jgi:SAM-dependent methyltransferase
VTALADGPTCQGCKFPLTRTLVDLGMQPLANSYLRPGDAGKPEPVFPLHARVCDHCLLVQVDRVETPEKIFGHYAYFSSISDSWLKHCSDYADAMVERFDLGPQSRVVEIASNDGYLLQFFVAKHMQVLGVEPAANVAEEARSRGVPTDVAFFGLTTAERLAESGWSADLLVAKNVLAHVPDINDFVAGITRLLKREGVFTVEFPHLLNLIAGVQFDTIYHEHFTYLSLLSVRTILERHGLMVFDVEKQGTHGGSLRLYVAHAGAGRTVDRKVEAVLAEEREARLDRSEGYDGFSARVRAVRDELVAFIRAERSSGKTICGYGAAAKGNTLLNYCGITSEDLPLVADLNPMKQGTLLPGSHIPVGPVEALLETRPNYILILPWNLREEIVSRLRGAVDWGPRFVTAIPSVKVHSDVF